MLMLMLLVYVFFPSEFSFCLVYSGQQHFRKRMSNGFHLCLWSGNLFLIAPFPDLCLLVPFNNVCVFIFIMEGCIVSKKQNKRGTVAVMMRVQ